MHHFEWRQNMNMSWSREKKWNQIIKNGTLFIHKKNKHGLADAVAITV